MAEYQHLGATTPVKLSKISVERIISPKEVWEKYICPFCEHLLQEAVQSSCGHRVCRSCADEAFSKEENPVCPVKEDGEQPHNMIPDEDDEDEEDKTQKYFPDKFAQRDILRLIVTCEFPGCPAKVSIKELKNHMSKCEFAGEICKFCNEFIPVNQLKDHPYECPSMEKTCPLSSIEWVDDLDRQLNDSQKQFIKEKWNDTLAHCKGKKLRTKEYEEHVDHKHESHWKTIAGVINILMMLCAQLFKNQSGSGDVERDGHPKALLKLAGMQGIDAAKDNSPSFLKELEGQLVILRKIVDEMKKDSNKNHQELVTAQTDLSLALEQIKDLRAKVDFFEQKLSTREQQLEEKDFRISLLEAANYDGIMIWRISGFESRTKDARDARYTSIFSLPFYTSKYGYKMCLRLYPLGDGMGKNTHLSLFFVVMKSEYDSLLQWPFTNKVTLTLINQSGGPDVTDTFKPDPKSSSFQRPKTEMNVASGCPRFVPLDDLHRNGFIKDDTIFIKVKVETISTRY